MGLRIDTDSVLIEMLPDTEVEASSRSDSLTLGPHVPAASPCSDALETV